jgi:hypothetical protein
MNKYIPKKKYFDKKGNQISEEMYELLKKDALLEDEEKPKYLKPIQKKEDEPTFFGRLKKVLEGSDEDKDRETLQRLEDEKRDRDEKDRETLERLEEKKDRFGKNLFFKARPGRK